jgi:hypothetical protein
VLGLGCHVLIVYQGRNLDVGKKKTTTWLCGGYLLREATKRQRFKADSTLQSDVCMSI